MTKAPASMSIAEQISEIAAALARDAEQRAKDLQRQLLALEARALAIKTELDAAHLAHDRLANFQIKLGADYQCPRCWIENETRAALIPLPGIAREDVFHCRDCQFEFSVPA